MPGRDPLDEKSRSELVEEARRLGVERPERMTRVELRDEIVRKTLPPSEQAEARGLFGVARSMLASVVESGLNLPDAAKLIRGRATPHEVPASSQNPVSTVTLAEIYAAQGHRARALRVLEDVLAQEPDHEEALRVRAELLGEGTPAPSSAIGHQPPAPDPRPPRFRADFGATTEYVPGGFVDTTGEEIKTGKPPRVEEYKPAVAAEEKEPATVASPADPQRTPLGDAPLGDDTAPSSGAAPVQESVAQASASEPSGSTFEEESVVQTEAPRSAQPVLLLAQKSGSLFVYWELPRAALLKCSVDEGEGRAALRLVGFVPTGQRPGRLDKTIPLQDTSVLFDDGVLQLGHYTSREFGPPTIVRAALGWQSEDGFLPLIVGRFQTEATEDGHLTEALERAAPYLD